MKSEIVKKALKEIYKFLTYCYSSAELEIINKEIINIVGNVSDDILNLKGNTSYDDIQNILSVINEKESIRKSSGVYYTSSDVVKFIFSNTVKLLYGNLKNTNLHVLDLNGIPYKSFCYNKTIFDPTCGAGQFLISALSIKFDLADLRQEHVDGRDIYKIVSTVYGNDINSDSTTITKLRIFLYVLNRYGVSGISGISKILNLNFVNYDFINLNGTLKEKFDIIIGNPPYVEDSKCDTEPKIKYGNVYANVLDNVTKFLSEDGAIGFIVPLSYVSTPRMKKIRNVLNDKLSQQFILSYCDRPDCLFSSVHQKLCILLGKRNEDSKVHKIFTGNYQFWYKEERDILFQNVPAILNKYVEDEYIPKIGTLLDLNIYKKVYSTDRALNEMMSRGTEKIYLNMRAAFWIKAFRNEHLSSEYKVFECENKDFMNLCFCILNSSLFWWYWICISDCWHITSKELKTFAVPIVNDFSTVAKLANKLEQKLEKTKLYVGTKQTEYEYKHKECTKEIHEIDDYICKLYGLSEEETIYIKNFAYKYRVSGGFNYENN